MDAYKKLDGKKDRKVEVILMDYDTNQKGMDKYMTKSKINFPGLKRKLTETSPLTKAHQTKVLPTVVLATKTHHGVITARAPVVLV